MKLYARADFEAEFEPKNLKKTLIKILVGIGVTTVIYVLEGWKVYLTPLIVVLLYYIARIIPVLNRKRSS